MTLDCNTLFGYWQKDTQDRSVERLLHIIRTNGIDRALTCSGRGVWDSFAEGNEETLRLCAAHPELLPVATVRPSDYYQCREEIASLRERGFQMLRFFPATQGWLVGSLSFRRLLDSIVDCGLPLLFDNDYNASPLIAPLVDYFRGTTVPLIFSAVSYGLSEFLAACEVHEHCYTDTWQLFLLNEIEIIRDEVGIGHILLGTKAPFEMPGPCLEMVARSRLSEGERARVLGGSVASLIPSPPAPLPHGEGSEETAAYPGATRHPSLEGGGTAASHPAPLRDGEGSEEAADEGGKAASGGRRLPVPGPRASHPIIDVHAHYGGWVGLPNPCTSIDDLLATLKRFNIEHCCLSSASAIGYDAVEGNEQMRPVIEGHEALHGYIAIHPGYAEASLAQLRELLALPNWVGGKLHPKHCGYQADAPEARPLLKYLCEQGKPLLVHTWFDEMCEAMGRAADEFPELTLIMGHMGGDDWETALRVAAERPNLYLELCSGLSPWGKMEKTIAAVGAERVLFGSDLTLLDPGYTIGLVTGAEVGEEEKRMILYGNAKRIFGF